MLRRCVCPLRCLKVTFPSLGVASSRRASGATTPTEPVLPVNDIQGDLILGFNKPADLRVVLGVNPKKVSQVKQWLRQTVMPALTSTADVKAYRAKNHTVKGTPFHADPSTVFVNVAFSYNALSSLLQGTKYEPDLQLFSSGDSLPSPFKIGSYLRASVVGDDPSQYSFGGWQESSLLLNMSADTKEAVAAKATALLAGVTGSSDAPLTVIDQTTAYRGNKADPTDFMYGHEHYGHMDGLSQPEVRGLYAEPSSKTTQPIVRRKLATADPRYSSYAAPGFLLMDTGHFVLGDTYRNQMDVSMQPTEYYPPWCANGAFAVYRKISQDVYSFWADVKAAATALAQQNKWSVDDDAIKRLSGQIAAKCVGRWWDGTPLIFQSGPLTGLEYPPPLGTAGIDFSKAAAMRSEKNGFNFGQNTNPWALATGRTVGNPDPGSNGVYPSDYGTVVEPPRCPFSAHIRKVNPRDETTDLGDPQQTLRHRVIRRGNNYGARAVDVFDARRGPTPTLERGLDLVMYGASIEDQFEFLQAHWANSFDRPISNMGDDGIIGLRSPQPRSVQSISISFKDNSGTVRKATLSSLQLPEYYTVARGMQYYLLPPISAVRNVIAAEASP